MLVTYLNITYVSESIAAKEKGKIELNAQILNAEKER